MARFLHSKLETPGRGIGPLILLGFLLSFSFARAAVPAPHPDAAATLVVYNKKEPRSEEIARYYAAKRGIPENNLCGLECPTQEEISRADYNSTILAPIREFVQTHGLIRYGSLTRPDGNGKTIAAMFSRLKYMTLCYGIPLKIAHDPKEFVGEEFKEIRADFRINAAAVDSELANLPAPQSLITAFLPNPLYKKTFDGLRRWNERLICVARLDGPNADVARQLVDDALEAERVGLYGRVFFDLRGLPDSNPGYKLGDDWIRAAQKMFEIRNWEVISDEKEAVFGEEMDATSCAVYAGWYAGELNGPFRAPGFRFRTGAIAYHIHSFSAESLRSTDSHWTGPLVARGAAASLGCVYEPYLQMTPNVDVLFERLLSGSSFGEAAYSSQQFLSWMNTVVGDPLYRPFGISHEDRLAEFESRYDTLTPQEEAALAWCYRFQTRKMFLAGKPDAAIRLAYEQAVRLRQRSLWVGLANLYLLKGENQRAAEAAKTAVRLTANPENEQGTLRFAAQTCAQIRDWDSALDYYRRLLMEFPKLPNYASLCAEAAKAASAANRESEVRFFENLKKTAPSSSKFP